MPKDYIQYIVLPEKVDLVEKMLGILEDPNIPGGTPTVIGIDIKYSGIKGTTYRLTHKGRRPSEGGVPVPNRGPGSRGGKQGLGVRGGKIIKMRHDSLAPVEKDPADA